MDVLIVAGEASGDLHGASLWSELTRRAAHLRGFGLGGSSLRAAGCETLADSSEIAVVGLFEVLRILRRARQIFALLLAEVEKRGVKTAILIDSPDFNLRLAKELKKRGVFVVYYISPQLWAWRKGRIRAIKRDVDLMLVLFPFELEFYQRHGVDAVHVGHPLVDEVPQLEHRWDIAPPLTSAQPVRVALLPGSRRSELKALLPTMLEAVRRMAETRPIEALLIQAPILPDKLFDEYLAASGSLGKNVKLERIRGDRFPKIADAHLALCASGTATLEVALLGTPMLVLYRLKALSFFLARLLVDLPHFSMVNLVLSERVVPELLQGQAAPDKVAATANNLLSDLPRLEQMRQNLKRLRPALGASGASSRAAEAVLERWSRL